MKVEVIRDGQVRLESTTTSEEPRVVLADTSDIGDFSKLRAEPADACIYCGSLVGRSREHILPFALGGTVTIQRGSCEKCRKITHHFETAVLRGPMRMVRYIQNAPSRSKHKDVPKTIPVKSTRDGRDVVIEALRDEAPILLPFPVFEPPGSFRSNESQLKLVRVVTGSFGGDPEKFAKHHGAKELEIKIGGTDAIAFARMLAKIAYANAHANDQLRRLKDKSGLVRAMMEEPNNIGRFVGTLPSPFKKYPGLQHRISLQETAETRLLFSEIQLFASAGTPTYVVVLGTLNDEPPSEEVES